MRVLVIVKASRDSEGGVMPSEKLLHEMMAFNEALAKAGVLLAGEGLQASSKGKRVRFEGKKRIVLDGPFRPTGQLVAGYWLWQVGSMDEAVEWVKRCPNPHGGADTEIEIRPLFESADFDEVSPGIAEKEERLRKSVAGAAKR